MKHKSPNTCSKIKSQYFSQYIVDTSLHRKMDNFETEEIVSKLLYNKINIMASIFFCEIIFSSVQQVDNLKEELSEFFLFIFSINRYSYCNCLCHVFMSYNEFVGIHSQLNKKNTSAIHRSISLLNSNSSNGCLPPVNKTNNVMPRENISA